MSATVREAVFCLLREFGLTTIFGNPGSTELPMFRDFPADFRYVLGLQESVVVAMADGFAQARGGAALDRPATPMERIVERRPRLTASNQRVAALVLQDPALVARAGIAAIAAAARVSPSQVTRFCRALDFDGLVDFRRRLAASLAVDDAWRGISPSARARSADRA